MKLKLLGLCALLAYSTAHPGGGSDQEPEATIGSFSEPESSVLLSLQQRIRPQGTSIQGRSSSSSSSDNPRLNVPYDISKHFQINHLGTTFDIPIKHINEANLLSFTEYLKENKQSNNHICVRLSRAYSLDNGGRPTSSLTVSDLKLIAKYLPGIRGLNLQDTGLDLEMVTFLGQENSFSMLEWLNISFNFKSTESENSLTLEEKALRLIFAPHFAPLLKRLEIKGFNIDTSSIQSLKAEADKARMQLTEEQKKGMFGAITAKHLTTLDQRLTILTSVGNEHYYLIPENKHRKRAMYEALLEHTLKKHKALHKDTNDYDDKGKEEAESDSDCLPEDSDEL